LSLAHSLRLAATPSAANIINMRLCRGFAMWWLAQVVLLGLYPAEASLQQASGMKSTSEGSKETTDMLKTEATSASSISGIRTVPLRKQYVPMVKNNRTVAYKTAYFGEVHVGTGPQPQRFTVVFDTGSGHLILPSSTCRSETCEKHTRYNRSSSSTAVDIEHNGLLVQPNATKRDQLNITFGMGRVVGEFVQDIVCLGQNSSDCMELRLVVAKYMSPDPFGLFSFDGVLGLGLDALTLNPRFNFFGQMVAQGLVTEPRFAVYLARHENGQNAITFGGHEDRCAASEIQWTPVAKQELGYWQVQIKAVRIGDLVLDDCADGGCRAILDTGTSLLSVPRQSSRTMHSLLARPLPGEGVDHSKIDCRTVPGAQIHFDLGVTVISLGVEDYSRPAPYNATTPGSDKWRMYCRSLLLPVDIAPPLGPRVFIWGEPVLRKYYTVYDWASKRIGFSVAGLPPAGLDSSVQSSIGTPPSGALVAGVPLRSNAPEGQSANSTFQI